MKAIENLKIGIRLTLFFAITVILINIGFAYTGSQMRNMKEQVDLIYNDNLVSIDHLLQADRDAYQSSVNLVSVMSPYVQKERD